MLSMRQSKQIGDRSPLRLRPSLSSLRILPVPLRAAPCLWSTSHIRRLSLSLCLSAKYKVSRRADQARSCELHAHLLRFTWSP